MQPPADVKQVLGSHEEALVLLLDPDEDTEGESTIACFMKMGKPSRLAAYLPDLLEQLLKTSSGKSSSDIPAETATGTKENHRTGSADDQSGCKE